MGPLYWLSMAGLALTVIVLLLKGTDRFTTTEQGFKDYRITVDRQLEAHEAAHNYHYEAGRKHEQQDQEHFRDTVAHSTAEERHWETVRFEKIEKQFDRIDEQFDKMGIRFDKIEVMIRDRD